MNILFKRSRYFLFIGLATLALSFRVGTSLEDIKFSNFKRAIKNNSTFGYFTVITVKNLNTGEVKELCAKGNFVSGALHRELNADYDNKGERSVLTYFKNSKKRYFELRNKEALENVSFFTYSANELKYVEKKYNIDSIVSIIKTRQELSIRLDDDEMKALAHILFNKGYLTGENDCWGGSLQYVNKEMAKRLE